MDFIFTSHTKIKEEFNVLVMDICAGAIHQDLPGIPMDCIITSPTKKIIRKNSKVWSWTYVCATVITFSKTLHFHWRFFFKFANEIYGYSKRFQHNKKRKRDSMPFLYQKKTLCMYFYLNLVLKRTEFSMILNSVFQSFKLRYDFFW